MWINVMFLLVNIYLTSSTSKFSMSEFITDSGYPFEEHQNIRTEDNYLISIQRIPNGKFKTTNCKNPVVLLMHGVGGSAANWVVLGANKSIAFLLADRGYDVWMGDSRGTTRSKKHLNLDPNKDPDYWNFSWHEVGLYDLPAIINYILKVTGQSQLIYIGHSQGTTAYFVMSSIIPTMNNYVKVALQLAPAAFLGIDNNFVPKKEISDFFGQLETSRKKFGINEVDMNLAKRVCSRLFLKRDLCDLFMILFGTPASVSLTKTDPVLLARLRSIYPESASARQYLHYMQLMITGEFKQYDFGSKINMNKYGSLKPPYYNLTKSVTPTALFYSNNDVFIPAPRVAELSHALPNVILDYLIPMDNFAHADFLFSEEKSPFLQHEIFNVLSSYACK